MSGVGRSNAYGPLPFSYLAGKDNPTATSGVGLRKEGVYDSHGDIYAPRAALPPGGRDTTGRDSGLGRSNHGTGERGYFPGDGDPETGIGYTNHAAPQHDDDLDFGGPPSHMGSTFDNFILKKGPNDSGEGGASPRASRDSPSPDPGVRGQPISADFYNPPPSSARDTDIDSPRGEDIVDDLEKIPKKRPTIFSMIQESEKHEKERGLHGYSSFQDPHNNMRPSTSSDEFNTMIRTDSYFDNYKEQKKCSRSCAVIAAVVIAIICLGVGFVVGWFVYPIVNGTNSTEVTTAVPFNGAGASSTTTTTLAPSTALSTTTTTLSTTTTSTTTTTTPPPMTPSPSPTTSQAPAQEQTTVT